MTEQEIQEFNKLKAERDEFQARYEHLMKVNGHNPASGDPYFHTGVTRETIDFTKYPDRTSFVNHMESSKITLVGSAGNQLLQEFATARPELFKTS